MAATLCQKWLTIFLSERLKKLKIFKVQIPPVCGPNTYQIVYGETLEF